MPSCCLQGGGELGEGFLKDEVYDAAKFRGSGVERELFIDNLLVRIHFIILMIRWTGLAPWEVRGYVCGRVAARVGRGSVEVRQEEQALRRRPSPQS